MADDSATAPTTLTLTGDAKVLLEATQYFAGSEYQDMLAKVAAWRAAVTSDDDKQRFANIAMVLNAQPQLIQGALNAQLAASVTATDAAGVAAVDSTQGWPASADGQA